MTRDIKVKDLVARLLNCDQEALAMIRCVRSDCDGYDLYNVTNVIEANPDPVEFNILTVIIS